MNAGKSIISQCSIIVGRIVAAHGIRGEVILHSFTQVPLDIADYDPLSEEGGTRTFRIIAARQSAKGIIARIAGVNDRNAAEALAGVTLAVDRKQLPEPEPDAFYHADLIGLAAVDPSGSPVGTVIAVHNHGASDIIEIKPEAGDTLLVPFTAAFVPAVDLASRRMIVAMDTDETDRLDDD
jgi:16S rRNA processing protein RimM